ncbi:vesicle-associated protein 2-2-like [Prunus avium]|uniref:Vesicle-associated protein 2-2-like n=1 Tax=Prunus avium TaxID=42229 RepID=A0A6P5RZH8_PRUAV|nr:vesicle-associated protein 2-2-like [Prunus avium]
MMMTTELLDVQPRELKFTFELKKQSLCSIQLGNKSDHYVAFKVKTTSPKKYCVRPNAGIIKPKASCDFTVTMQAQRVVPPDLQCKDKFLILSTVIPFGTTEEEITSDMFSKDSGKYIEEKKLRVVLISPPSSPVFVPINGESKQDPCYENSVKKDRVLSGVENIPPPHGVAEDVEGFETYKDMDESRAVKDVEELKPAKDVVELKPANVVEELKPAKDGVALNLTKDFEELKLKLNTVDSKLKEADLTIMKLTEERSMTTREKNMLKHELELLRRKNNVKRIMVGFPLFYVCMVALISLAIGYYIHP